MSISKTLKKDSRYIKAMNVLSELKADMDTKKVLDELFILHPSRGVSALRPNQIMESSVATLLKSTTQEIATRSRVTTVKMTALRSLLSIEEIVDPLRKYLLTKYSATLKEYGYSTVSSQRAAVDSALKLFLDETRSLNYILKIADLVIEDVDSAGWGLKRISDTLEQVKKDR